MFCYCYLFMFAYHYLLFCLFRSICWSSSSSFSFSSLLSSFSFSKTARHYHARQFLRLAQLSIMSIRVNGRCLHWMIARLHHFQNSICFSFCFIFLIIVHIIIIFIKFVYQLNLIVTRIIFNFLVQIFSCSRGFGIKYF